MLADTIKLGIAVTLIFVAIIGKVFWFSEWLGKHPNIKKIAESRTTYIVLLIVAIGLLAGVFQDINAVREVLNVPPPTPKAPPAPLIIAEVEPLNQTHGIAKSSAMSAPITQSGKNNIAQVGDNNQATINPESPEKSWAITNDICRKLLSPIKTAGIIQVSVGAFISDPDGANVVKQLTRCLPLVPGWNVGMAVLPPVPEGVTVSTSAENEPIAASLRDGLLLIGFDANIKIVPNSPELDISIGKHVFKTP